MGDLLESIHRRHGTSFVGFDFPAYVPNESDALTYPLMRLSGYKGGRFRELTFRHLFAVVEEGALFDPLQR